MSQEPKSSALLSTAEALGGCLWLARLLGKTEKAEQGLPGAGAGLPDLCTPLFQITRSWSGRLASAVF